MAGKDTKRPDTETTSPTWGVPSEEYARTGEKKALNDEKKKRKK